MASKSLKETIIHETIKLYSLKGFESTGINEIIEVANTSKGGFYNYFASKDELFYEVLAEAQKLWRERVLGGIREIDSPIERLFQILKNYKERYLKDFENFPGGCIFITLSVELDDFRPDLVTEVKRGYYGYKNLLKNIITEGVERGEFEEDLNISELANFLFIGMLGASVHYGVDKSHVILEESINSLINYLIILNIKSKEEKS